MVNHTQYTAYVGMQVGSQYSRACFDGKVIAVIPSVIHFVTRDEFYVGKPPPKACTTVMFPALCLGEDTPGHAVSDLKLGHTFCVNPRGVLCIKLQSDEYVTPEECVAILLKELRRRAEMRLGVEVRNCVCSTYTHYGNVQRVMMQRAVEEAGMVCVRLVNNASLSALSLSLDTRHPHREHDVAVLCLSGGVHLDLLNIEDGILEVQHSYHDLRCGRAMDISLFAWVSTKCAQHNLDPHLQEALLAECRAAKEVLSSRQKATIAVQEVGISVEVSRSDFEAACMDDFVHIVSAVEELCEEHVVDEVVLSGGCAHIPLLREMVGKVFGGLPMTVRLDDLVVQGADQMARMLLRPSSFPVSFFCPFSSIYLPLSVGFDDAGTFRRVLLRNASYPVRRTITTTVLQFSSTLCVRIGSGERVVFADNIVEGEVAVDGEASQCGRRVHITFDVDANSVLSVSVTDIASGNTGSATFAFNSVNAEAIEANLRGVLPGDDVLRAQRLLANRCRGCCLFIVDVLARTPDVCPVNSADFLSQVHALQASCEEGSLTIPEIECTAGNLFATYASIEGLPPLDLAWLDASVMCTEVANID